MTFSAALQQLALAFTGAIGCLALSFFAYEQAKLVTATVLAVASVPFTLWMNRIAFQIGRPPR